MARASRAAAALRSQVLSLNGVVASLKWKIIFSVGVQVGVAWLAQELSWPLVVLMAYTLGARVNTLIWASHFRRRACAARMLRVCSVCGHARVRVFVFALTSEVTIACVTLQACALDWRGETAVARACALRACQKSQNSVRLLFRVRSVWMTALSPAPCAD